MTDEKSVVTPGWCTNWEAFNTPRIWAMVADEDNAESWKQVAALGAMADKLKDQRSRLVAARDSLERAWPPATNPAADAFVSRINTLLANMDDTKTTAEQNAAHLGHVLETLRQAKTKIEPLYQRYLEKSDDLIPNWWDNAEDDLDKQARQHMIDAEGAVATHAEKIASPSPYQLNSNAYIDNKSSEFPPPGASSSGDRRSSGDSDRGGTVDVPHQPPPQLPGHNPIVPAGPSTDPTGGPALAGTLPAAPNVPPGSVPSSPTTAVPGPSVQPGTIIGGGGGFSPFRGVSRGKGSGFPVGRGLNSGGKPATPTWLPASHGQPGVFGATGQPARASQPRSPARRRGIASAGPLSEDRSRRSDDERDIEFDPDDPWATAEGVPPVIEPSRAQPRHDPGPGVIGRYE